MKSKAWIIYLVLNLVLVGVVGFFTYKIYFPDVIEYPDPVTVFEQTLAYGDTLKLIDPNIADASETECTFHFSLRNDDPELEKSFYLYMESTGDQILTDSLTIKMQDKGLLISYQANVAAKKVTLKPNESIDFTVKIYIDLLQIIDPSIFEGKTITFKVIDDQVRFYGLDSEKQNTAAKQDKKDDQSTKNPTSDTTDGNSQENE